MKQKLALTLVCLMLAILSACGQADNTVETISLLTEESITDTIEVGELEPNIPEATGKDVVENEDIQSETETAEPEEKLEIETDPYVGEYNDYDTDEPSLQIQKNVDNTYTIQIRIFRTAFLDKCVGVLTEKGIEFIGASIGWEDTTGTITLDGEIATVTFTNSAWNSYSSVNTYEYRKTSDVPNIYKPSTFTGEYNDYATNESKLQIRKNDDKTYTIQIDIPGMIYLEDGVGELGDFGLEFTATAPNGEEIIGLLVLCGEEVTLEFTNSAWSKYSDVTEFQYYKVSDTPNISGGY